MNRFECLDSWRGISACLVTMLHMPVYGHISDLSFIQNSYLFVDLFFVLSGFIIATNYKKRLLEGFGLARFMVLRFGRLYPLHLFMLCCFLLFESISLIPTLAALRATAPFESANQGLDTIVANFLMIHSLNVMPVPSWNYPSWSISTEFWTYLIFALALYIFRKHLWIPIVFTIVASPIAIIFLNEQYMDTTIDYGLIRTVYGFTVGVVCCEFYTKFLSSLESKPNTVLFTTFELVSIIIVGLFVTLAGKHEASVLAPFVFAISILVFSLEAGYVSKVLQLRPFLLLGTLSYSIYMVHAFLFYRIMGITHILERLFSTKVFSYIDAKKYIDIGLWQGDFAMVFFLFLTILASLFTYKLVEEPGRDWFRKLAKRI